MLGKFAGGECEIHWGTTQQRNPADIDCGIRTGCRSLHCIVIDGVYLPRVGLISFLLPEHADFDR